MRSRDVLVVDDTEDCRVLLRGMLESKGHHVRLADCGSAALAEVAAKRPDVIMLDLMMPGMSGLEVLTRLRANAETAAIPVILVTARTHDDDVLDGYQHGADYYITKPCTSRQVNHGVALVLGDAEAAAASAA